MEEIAETLSERDRMKLVSILAKKTNHTLLHADQKSKAEELYAQSQEDLHKLMNYKD